MNVRTLFASACMIPVAGLLALAGVFSDARPALAQTQQDCPLPPGVTPPDPLSVTAQQVEAGSATLSAFVLDARNRFSQGTPSREVQLYVGCRMRLDGSDMHSGSTYFVQLTPDGRVFVHSKNMALSGRQLNLVIYGAILQALGISLTDLTDPAAITAAFMEAAGRDGGEFNVPYIPGASGYAAVYLSQSYSAPIVLLAGFDLTESHLAEEDFDYLVPAVTAREVVDRETLKAFVTNVGKVFLASQEKGGDPAAISKARVALRDPNGPFRHGSVYLYILDLVSGIILFHGAFPDRHELRPLIATVRDEVTGKLVLPQVIEAAKSSPEGGFLEYYWDDPTDDSDRADVPKVGYARRFTGERVRADGSVLPVDFIIGSGFYGSAPEPPPLSEACPRPEGLAVNPLEIPAVTAAQAAESAGNLKAFSLAAKRYLASIRPGQELAFSACLIRHEGPWKSGANYVVTLSTDGRVLFHSKNVALSGRPLKPAVWKAIAAATGAAALRTTGDFGNPEGGALPAQIGGGYAVGFKRTAGVSTFIMTAGLDIGESHLSEETVDPGNPRVRADQVVDRASLKTFVTGAAAYVGELLREGGRGALAKAKSVLREPNGRWRHGPVYLFMMEPNGYTVFHGAFPDKFEFQAPTTTLRDEVTGKLILPQIIEAAKNPGGGFVRYYFDNPDDDSDSADVPKVTYAFQHVFRIPRPDGSTIEYPLIFGAGIYLSDPAEDMPQITLAVDPESVTEGLGAQTVTVTATLAGIPVYPLETVIDLSLSGTATSDDYSVSGNMSVTIPAEATEGSTRLTLTATGDSVYESGGETIVVTARYDGADLDTATITVIDAYDAPATVGALPAVTLEAGDSETIDAGGLFSGTDLSFSAASSDNGVASAVLSGATLTVTGVRKGAATVTISARNAAGEASGAVSVTVTAIAAERMAYEHILGAMGRNMLSSVSTTIGGRFSAGGGGGEVIVGGRRIDGLASGVSALAGLTGHRRQAASKELALLADPDRYSVSGDNLLQHSSFAYAFEDHEASGGLRWSVWGAGDMQNFQGEPDVDTSYDGDLRTAYLGFDVAAQRSWMAGIAFSHAIGQSDYDVTVASGSLESRLTSVLPYVRWSRGGGLTEVWSIAGLGTGEVEVEDATSDLSMRMAMVGVRTRLAGTGGMGLDVVGDAGLARLSTSDSESASLSDISSDVQRVRVGLEGSRSAKLAGGTTITPYAQFAGRYDGGAGQTGQGLEVSGGLRLSGGRVGINAQGRFLAVHTAEGYSENGVSLVAYLSPGAGGRGLSMSVAPRMGAATSASGMMWRERPLEDASAPASSRYNNARALRAEVGYGLAYPSMGVLMTPFGEMHLHGDDRRQMRLGARLARSGAHAGGASLELSGMRLDRRGIASDHRVGLLARMSF